MAQLEGKNYLVVMDKYSGWPEVTKLRFFDTNAVTDAFEKLIQTFGIPERIRTNGGQQFRSEFKTWCETRLEILSRDPRRPRYYKNC